MAAINDLISRIQDPELRASIQAEVDKLSKQKKFGLVFEDHIPECTPLYEMPIKVGSLVAPKNGSVSDLHVVTALDDGQATCLRQSDGETVDFPVDSLVSVARFGEPIYPYLKPLDAVCNAPDSDLWHTLIEADNYHALQLLEYLYAGKVDCIYIDPPYNTGAKDWKYNNDFVDGSDSYRHSKWLSFMEKRLKLAKKLLNTKDSVLIVTIDEKEYLHLGCLLEELFPEAHQQMVSIVINPNGVARDHEMYRVEEYAFFVYIGEAGPVMLEDPLFTSDVNQRKELAGENNDINYNQAMPVRWERLLRGGSNSDRSHSPGCFYPVYIDPVKKRIVEIGEAIGVGEKREIIPDKEGLVTIWPISEGTREEKVWQTTPVNLRKLVHLGYAKVGSYNKKTDRWSLLYLGKKQRERIEQGQIIVRGRDENGVVIVEEAENRIIKRYPKSIWNRQTHNAGEYGSRLIRSILPGRIFSYPKSLYAVEDALRTIYADKPDAFIIDFFAGSGTTMHAVNLLNAEDGGRRRCIMVTNNEVSADEAKSLTAQRYKPGDEEWEKLGIARYVTWPRTVCSIEGHDVNGNPLKGNYIGSDLPMAEGFKANAAFFKLGFLDKASVRIGRQFREMLPTLWMKAGCHGPCPGLTEEDIPAMLVLPENHMAILNDNSVFAEFSEAVEREPKIDTVYLVTDSDADYRNMARELSAPNKFQLYKDYLDNFRINSRR